MLAAAILGAGLLVAVGLVLGLRAWTDWRYGPLAYAPADVPARPVALVFGAGIWPDGSLSDILADRVAVAAELYRLGKVDKLLMSGDGRFAHHDEPAHMRTYALALGVPDEDIVLDYAGWRTYDSCYRAVRIFRVNAAILVTQAYHLDRALFLADRLGIDAVGVPADRRDYLKIRGYWWRELAATAVAWWEASVSHPLPVMGAEQPIWPHK
jgi:SanA protein